MKFEFCSDEKKEGNNIRVKLRLRLEEPDEDGNVRLIVADGDGDWEYELLYLNKDGTYSLCNSIGPDLGFLLDEEGRIKRGEDR